MIKKKLIALGVSAVAVTAVVGAGFAAWTFESNATADKNLGLTIASATSFGKVEFDANAPTTVVLDQTGVLLSNGTSNVTDLVAKWTVKTDTYTASQADVTYSVSVFVKDALATYVNCGTTPAEATSAKTGYTEYKFTLTNPTSSVDGDNTVVTLSLANPLEFVTEITTFEQYKTMVSAIKSDAGDVDYDTEYTVDGTEALVVIQFNVEKTTT